MSQRNQEHESALDALRQHFRPRAFRPAFASVAEAVRNLSSKPQRQGSVKEKATSTMHPCELCDLEGGKCAQLLGVGCAPGSADRHWIIPDGPFCFFAVAAEGISSARQDG